MRPAAPIALALAVLVLLAPARGQVPSAYTDHPEEPPGPVAAVIRELIAAVNASDPETFLAFIDTYATGPFRDEIPAERHVEVYRGVCSETGGVDYYGYRTYDPPRPDREHVFIVRDRLLGGWRAFMITTDPADPGRFVGLQLQPARPPSDLPAPEPLALEAAMEQLDAAVDRLAAADAFSGAVLVARDGEVVYGRALGEASKRFGAVNTMDTRFNLGSMNKMFTALAVCRLAEQGRLSLDDPLSKWVDESWLPTEVAERIRIRHMLNHTSGLGSYFTDAFWSGSRTLHRRLEDFKPLVRGESLAFEPGTAWRYSNTAFLLLGVVIERASGEDYFEHIRRHVYAPAGMSRSDSYEMDVPVENLAIGYVPEWGPDGAKRWRNNLYLHVIKGGPAGGGFSTVRDLLAFDAALRSGTLCSPETREAMWTARPEAASPDYGYGFSVARGPLGRVVGHGGGFPGLNGQLDMYLDAGYTVAVLSNYDRGASPVARLAGELLERVR
jgi:CubicO group peptidase (beta-lactamase class C family)